jgi:hypothetical protein
MRETQEGEASQVELFLNSVPLLASLSREEKLALVDAVDKQVFAPGVRVINQVRARRVAEHGAGVAGSARAPGRWPLGSASQQGVGARPIRSASAAPPQPCRRRRSAAGVQECGNVQAFYGRGPGSGARAPSAV